jgi:hypothetical protein
VAKRQMMLAWCAWLDKWAERAIKEDPRLLSYDWVCEAIYRNRYGEKQLESGERLNVRMLFVAL